MEVKYITEANEPVDSKVYKGKLSEKIPELKQDGYMPASLVEVMEEINKSWEEENSPLGKNWGFDLFPYSGNRLECRDGIISHPDGRFKVVYDLGSLIGKTGNIDSKTGSLVLPKGTFEEMPAKYNGIQLEFNQENLTRHLNSTGLSTMFLETKMVQEDEVLKALFKGNQRLLEELAGQIYTRQQNIKGGGYFEFTGDLMRTSFYIPETTEETGRLIGIETNTFFAKFYAASLEDDKSQILGRKPTQKVSNDKKGKVLEFPK